MVARSIDSGNTKSNLRLRFKVFRKMFGVWFRKTVLHKEYLTIGQFKKSCKNRSKNELIDEILKEAAKVTRNINGMTPQYRKSLRKYPKKKLINALIELKLNRQFGR